MDLIEKAKHKLKLKLCLSPRENGNLMANLTLGELLEGEVIECLDNKKIAICIKDSKIVAESDPDLRPGDRIVVEVIQLEPNAIFSLIFRRNERFETVEVKV